MTIEIKVSGANAAETVADFLALAGHLGASHPLPVPVTGQLVTSTTEDDDTGETVADGTVDAEGLPFDDRIHAKASQPFKADGTWKRRKNISDELYNSVRAELKARAAASGAAAAVDTPAPAPQVAQTPTVAVAAPVVETPPPPAPVIAEPAAVVADVPPAPAPAPSPSPAPSTGKTHADLTGALTKVLSAINSALPGKAAPLLMGIMASYGEGVKSVAQVPADKIDECYNLMQRMAADPANAEAIAAGLM